MDLNTYIKESSRTVPDLYNPCTSNMDLDFAHFMHGAIGLTTESGELLDTIKKCLFYKQPLDEENIKEELGDIMWYFALCCRALGIKPEDIMESNINKLKERYPHKYSDDLAIKRMDKQ